MRPGGPVSRRTWTSTLRRSRSVRGATRVIPPGPTGRSGCRRSWRFSAYPPGPARKGHPAVPPPLEASRSIEGRHGLYRSRQTQNQLRRACHLQRDRCRRKRARRQRTYTGTHPQTGTQYVWPTRYEVPSYAWVVRAAPYVAEELDAPERQTRKGMIQPAWRKRRSRSCFHQILTCL